MYYTNIIKQGNLLIASSKYPGLLTRKVNPGKRGAIKGFSAGSKRRLKYFLARCKKSNGVIFVTLTAREDFTHANVRAFLKRFFNKYGRFCTVWKKEIQSRGVIHYHLLIMGRLWIDAKWITEVWQSILGVDYRPSTDIGFKPVGRAMAYICKYIYKDYETSGAASVSERAGSPGYLEDSNISGGAMGRVWGVECRDRALMCRIEYLKYSDLTDKQVTLLEKLKSWIKSNNFRCETLKIVEM